MSLPNAPKTAADRIRQRRLVLALAAALFLGGLFVLLFLDRVPLPMRLAMGLGDLIAASVLLVLARQKFKVTPPL